MPRTCIDTADAMELTETLQLIARWLANDLSSSSAKTRPNARSCRQPSTQLRRPGPFRGYGRVGTHPDRPQGAQRDAADHDRQAGAAAELHEIFSDPEPHTIGDGPLTSLAQTAEFGASKNERF